MQDVHVSFDVEHSWQGASHGVHSDAFESKNLPDLHVAKQLVSSGSNSKGERQLRQLVGEAPEQVAQVLSQELQVPELLKKPFPQLLKQLPTLPSPIMSTDGVVQAEQLSVPRLHSRQD